MNSLNKNLLCPSPTSSQKATNKYKEAANALFQKLNSLQQASENNKSHNHSALITSLNQKENKFFDGQKNKAENYSKILRIVANIEREVQDQANEQDKVRRAVAACIENAERDICSSFDRLKKERVKSESTLEQWIDGKIESFVLKSNLGLILDKNCWAKGPLVNSEPYLD